jgi:hypothetical protein
MTETQIRISRGFALLMARPKRVIEYAEADDRSAAPNTGDQPRAVRIIPVRESQTAGVSVTIAWVMMGRSS